MNLFELAKVFWPTLLAASAVGIAAGIVGVFVLLRREALAALALPQVVAVGAAIGLKMGWPGLPPALGAVVIAVLMLVWSRRAGSGHWLLPSIYIAGLCGSFLIIAHAGAHVEEMQAMFTGIDVAVTDSQALFAAPILLVTGLLCAALWRRWLLLSQAPAAAEVAGLRPARWDVAFLALLATVLLLGTSTLGAVMVIAMLFLPAAAILPWSRSIPFAMIGAAVLSILFLTLGWIVSNTCDLPLSQSVGGCGFVVLILMHGLARL